MLRVERTTDPGLRRALLWGVLWALLSTLVLDLHGPEPWLIQPSRASELRASLNVLEHGGPLLLGYSPGGHLPFAVGTHDDQGIYVVVPLISRWLGMTDPVATLRSLWIAAWAITQLFSAVAARAIFRSGWAALLTPPALLVCIVSFGASDIYWVSAWVVVTFTVPLILLARARPHWAAAALLPIALIAGTVSTIRSDAGLPVALAAVAVAIVCSKRWVSRGAIAVAIALVYLAPVSVVLPAIREHRDQRVGRDLSAHALTSHPFWHTLYIGLGYTPNRYRLHYLDSYGIAAVQESHPETFLSPGYERVLHRQVEALVDHDPGFVAKVEAEKTLVELSHAGRYLLLLALLLPAALAAQGRARLRRSEVALFVPALAIGALPAIIAVPFHYYELTLLAALGTLGVLALGSAATRAEEAWHAAGSDGGVRVRTRIALHLAETRWPVRTTVRTFAATATVLLAVFAVARHFEAEAESWSRGASNHPTVVLAGVGSAIAPGSRR